MTSDDDPPLTTTKRYEARPEKSGRPAMVIARFLDEQGRRCTQFVATCASTMRDCDDDARFIAKSFNERDNNGH